MIIGVILVVVAVVVVFYLIMTYNRFINLRNGIESALKQINVALKKRLDLIGQVVDSVKGEMKFEKSTLAEITRMRSAAVADMPADKARQIDHKTNSILSGLKVQLEAYPDLKSHGNVAQLINTMNSVEDEIGRLRYTLNNTVQEYNTKGQMFPSNLIAGMFGFNKEKYLEFGEGDELKTRPKIELQ